MKTFDPSKPVRTTNGRSARVLCTDLKTASGETAGVAVIRSSDDSYEYTVRFNLKTGKIPGSPIADLENIPEHRFINVYRDSGTGATHQTLESAIYHGAKMRPKPSWIGTLEETEDKKFIAFHPAPPQSE